MSEGAIEIHISPSSSATFGTTPSPEKQAKASPNDSHPISNADLTHSQSNTAASHVDGHANHEHSHSETPTSAPAPSPPSHSPACEHVQPSNSPPHSPPSAPPAPTSTDSKPQDVVAEHPASTPPKTASPAKDQADAPAPPSSEQHVSCTASTTEVAPIEDAAPETPTAEKTKKPKREPKKRAASPVAEGEETAKRALVEGEASTDATSEDKGRKRERKQPERFQPTPSKKEEEKKTLTMPQGKGKKLGDISYVNNKLGHATKKVVNLLHSILFGRTGSDPDVKKNIRAFSGFAFEENSPEYAELLKKLKAHKNPDLVEIAKVLGQPIEKDMPVAESASTILKFLLLPADIEAPAKAKEGKGAHGRATASKVAEKTSQEVDLSTSSAEPAGEETTLEKTSAKSAKDTTKKGASTRGKSANKSTAAASDSKQPSDAELQNLIKETVAKLDPKTVTIQSACDQVFANYIGTDLAARRHIIRQTVKKLLD